MSYVGIIVLSVFASNALLSYGFSLCPVSRARGLVGLAAFVALVFVDAVASSLLWCIRSLALRPLGLEMLDLLLFVLIVVPVTKLLFRAIAGKTPFLIRLSAVADEIMLSSIVFGIALVSSRSGYSFPEALVASACSGLGYWLAVRLLDAIRERLELSAVPQAFKGPPALLISAGLMAMAFMGIDSIFVRNLVG